MSLHRFKAAYELKDVPLRPFNVLIGRNGAGKSTLLEALQWIDTAVRHTTDVACDRYNGIQDLINRRQSADGFTVETRLTAVSGAFARYGCNVVNAENQAKVRDEQLYVGGSGQANEVPLIGTKNGLRYSEVTSINTSADDRLALSRVQEFVPQPFLGIAGADIAAFWRDAVFLRLEPTDLARGGMLKRSSVDPMLDEVGQLLTALIESLDRDSRDDLVEMLQSVLPDFRGITVLRGGDSRTGNYGLFEARENDKRFLIPSWMLSEGTRRMTAIFALLARRPGPSLLCIEEVENGLDPVAVRKVLHHLQAASRRGVQVILTTHSPWLLDEVPLEDVLVVRRDMGDTTYVRLQDDPASKQSDPRVLPGGRYLDLLDR